MRTATQLQTAIPCECGDYEHRDLPVIGAPGFVAVPAKCPRCKGHFLVVFRVWIRNNIGAEFVKLVPISGKNEGSLREALRAVPGISDDNVEFMLTVALLLSVPRREKIPA